MRNQLAYAPEHIHNLDASGVSARDRYAHFGFELNCPMVFGKGKCNTGGMITKDREKAIGLTNFSMTRVR